MGNEVRFEEKWLEYLRKQEEGEQKDKINRF